ncbi:MAG: hypothetical protein IKD53_03895 [Clostridia bacterium]|nr:hypothetical protein [Clostridia bacterium]
MICDLASLEKCSIETCKTVIINPMEDFRTIKVVLAVSALLQGKGHVNATVNAIISRNHYSFPPSLAQKLNITTLRTYDALAKMIAHSCTQTGLSETFKEVFNFEGSELYLISIPKATGLTFQELLLNLDDGVPVGIYRENHER